MAFFKLVIDTGYDFKEGKIGGGQVLSKFKKPEKTSTNEKPPAKAKRGTSTGEVYEEAKENLYATVDNIKAFQQGLINFIKRVKQLPNDFISTQKSLSDTRESLVLTSDMLQKDLETKRLESKEFGKTVWKVVSLEAAKETYVELKLKFDSTADYVSEIKENPRLILKRKEVEKEVVIPVEVVKEESTIGKVWGALKSAKGGIDGAVSTVSGVTRGVQGLQKRIDTTLAEQAKSNTIKKIKLQENEIPSPSSISIEAAIDKIPMIPTAIEEVETIDTPISISSVEIATTTTPIIAPVVAFSVDETVEMTDLQVPIIPSDNTLQADMQEDVITTSNTVEVVGMPVRKNYSPYKRNINNTVDGAVAVSPPAEST
eukprot:CAMPEP_0119036700 /NCGR_PEP_ID=MMETSP1177-20130426/4602_1 /TAXON_ID=2985 /ORGANISM="Ochromonas sp, Strain CCMP1899" /LENGTH=371 /DNA_ID=CAMNT_0006996955 /DNA_START=485 /DNA_END=1600 /DNA_ORIENTATION=-